MPGNIQEFGSLRLFRKQVADYLNGLVSQGSVQDSGLTMQSGHILGRYSPTTGQIEQLEVSGPGAELSSGQILFPADATRADGLGQFANTSSADLRDIITDATGGGGLVFSINPMLSSPRLPTSGSDFITLLGAGSGNGTITFPAVSDTVVTRNTSETLTNKTLTSPVLQGPVLSTSAGLLTLVTGASGSGTVTIPIATDTAALLAATQTFTNKTLTSPTFTGSPVLRIDQNAPTIFEVRNDNTSSGAYCVYRMRSSASDNVDFLVNHNAGLAQFGGGGVYTIFQKVFDTFIWYSLAVAHLMRLTTAGLRVGATASAATTMLTVEGAISTSSPVTKTADFTLAVTESSIINNKSGSGCVMTSSPGSFPGRWLVVQNNQAQTLTSAASNVVPKGGGAAATAILPATATAWAFLQSNGTNWVIMMSGT